MHLHFIGGAITYYKEYKEIAARNRQDKNYASPDEFLSGFHKNDKLHLVITLCVYYGEIPWDGPLCLTDMMDIPEGLKELVSDYKINLLQLTKAEDYPFQHAEVQAFFQFCNLLYKKNFAKILSLYSDDTFTSELGLAVGAVTGSKELIYYTLNGKKEENTRWKNAGKLTFYMLRHQNRSLLVFTTSEAPGIKSCFIFLF